MMKNIHIFNHHHYHDTLHDQIGKGIPVFSGSRQKGGGLGSILGMIGRYGIPLLQKYVLPHAANAIMDTVSDFRQGIPLKETVKKNTVKMLKNVGKSLITPQTGSGLKGRKQKIYNSVPCGMSKKTNRTSVTKIKKPKGKTKSKVHIKKKTYPISKRDIFG